MDSQKLPKVQTSCCCGEASSMGMTEQEEDIISRMHKLVGDRWELIAGRIPGKTAKEIENFWLMKISDSKSKRTEQQHS